MRRLRLVFRMPTFRLLAMLAAAGLVTSLAPRGFAALAHVPSRTYGAPRIQLKGTARLQGRALASAGVVLLGTVLDDTNAIVPGARVRVAIAAVTGGDGTTRVALSSASPELCDAAAPGVRPRRGALATLEAADQIEIPTDERGAFCVRFTLAADRYVARLETLPTPQVEGAHLEFAFDVARPSPGLRFDPEPGALDVDTSEVAIDVAASVGDGTVVSPGAGLAVRLSNEAGAHLAEASTDPAGRAHFVVRASDLGPPGHGELRASFGGNDGLGPAIQIAPVLRRTHVHLVAMDATTGVLPAAAPEDGFVLRVQARPDCVAPSCESSPSGVVEARLADRSIGAAPIAGGIARLTIAFGWARPAPATIALAYLPDAPWFRPSPELALVQPVRPPGRAAEIATLLAGAVVIASFVLGRAPARLWRRRWGGGARSGDDDGAHAGPERAAAGGAPAQGWIGRLADAHDGAAVPGARVAVVRPSFDGTRTIVATVSDEAGAFALDGRDARPGDRLIIEAPFHVTSRRALPPFGRLEAGLVLRKRALLDKLVSWARWRGEAFDARPEPTPRQVRDAAAGELRVARWADAIEHAGFGRDPVDAKAESAVDDLAPDAPLAKGSRPT